jgi:hypothetical protein
MSITTVDSREARFKWLIRPFMWAIDACLMAMLFGVSLATDPSIAKTYVIAGLIASIGTIAGLTVWGIIRMRAAYEG